MSKVAIRIGLCIGLAVMNARAATPVDEADALIARGIELREQGRDDQALEVFRKADALAPSPRSRAQVGLAEQALGIWVAAENHLEGALAAKGDPWIERYRSTLAGALDVIRQHVGRLEVRGGVTGADVYVDGARIGSLPMTSPWRVEVGRRALQVRAPGYYATSRVTEVAPGQTTRETIELVPEPAAPAHAGTPRGGVDRVDGSTQRTLGWVFVGTGGALVLAGVGGLIARELAVSSYNSDGNCPGYGNLPQPPQCQDRISNADTWRTISIVSFIAGGAVGLGGAILLLTAPSPSSRAASTSAACTVAGLGVTCGRSF